MSGLIGQHVGRYHVLELLGEGGMATVYRAHDTRLDRDVALKVIRRGAIPPAHLAETLARFEREAKSLARLSHPNIVKVLDYGEQDGVPYLVMEYVPGGTLKQRLAHLQGAPMPWQEAARWLAPIARALEHAHQHGIVHRDIKPSNILISEDERPMLSDFGIVKVLSGEGASDLTATGVGIGTPEYMAPEQAGGEPIDHRCDIYSLCVVLYEMVTGHRPFQGDSPMSVLVKHVSEPLPDPRHFAPHLPEDVVLVLQKGLAKRPEERFPHMGALAEALERMARGERALPTPPPERPQARRRLAVLPLVGVLSLFLLAALAFAASRILPTGLSSPSPSPTQTFLVVSDTPLPSPTNTTAAPTPESTSAPPTATPPQGPVAGEERINPRDGAAVIYIPAGPFTMGLDEEQVEALTRIHPSCTQDRFAASTPAHQEQTGGFWIHKTEVTNLMYRRCVGEGDCPPSAAVNTPLYKHYYTDPQYQDYPVVFVGWLAAQNYCVWAGGRLPTEQEWEKAARGTDGRLFPWGDEPPSPELANVARFVGDTVIVGTYPLGASPYGVLDMAGNVREWMQDSFTTGITRGGAYGVEACFASSAYRNPWKQTQPDYKTGFRCVFDTLP
ncbi:MAG: hypothetical protein D6770_06025 [Anaerolineae bacterium]|nr:MAG: hypothetical protein D6770_06025 [Anaerolineae bacterium]